MLALLAATAVGIFGWVFNSRAMEKNAAEDKVFPVPGGGQVVLPKRYVVDKAAEGNPVQAAFLPDDLLLAYGKRRWNMGGNEIVSEALAVGHKTNFANWEEFRKEAASFLQDADWRGPAMEPLDWSEVEVDGIELREAGLEEVPGRRVIVGWKLDGRIWAAAFVKDSARQHGLDSMRQALETHTEENR